jgi:hypothetical protein
VLSFFAGQSSNAHNNRKCLPVIRKLTQTDLVTFTTSPIWADQTRHRSSSTQTAR